MRITQHEENKGEGTTGSRGGEGAGRGNGAKVRDGVEEKGDKGGEDGAEAADTVKPPFPLLFRLTPGLFIGGCANSGAEEMNMEAGGTAGSARLAYNLHLLTAARVVSRFVFRAQTAQ